MQRPMPALPAVLCCAVPAVPADATVIGLINNCTGYCEWNPDPSREVQVRVVPKM